MIVQVPGPGTCDTDWMPDYIPGPRRDYAPRSPSPGGNGHRKGHDRTGRPLGGKHSEAQRMKWREAKRRRAAA